MINYIDIKYKKPIIDIIQNLVFPNCPLLILGLSKFLFILPLIFNLDPVTF